MAFWTPFLAMVLVALLNCKKKSVVGALRVGAEQANNNFGQGA